MNKKLNSKGGKLLFLVFLIIPLLAGLEVPIYAAGSGFIRVYKSAFDRRSPSDLVFIGGSPKQDTTTGAHTPGDGSGYASKDDTAEYLQYNFTNISPNTVYILFKTDAEYAFAIGTLPEPPSVGSIFITSLAWYNLGVPPSPTITTPIDVGFESAKITGSCASGYDYIDGEWLQISTSQGFTSDVKNIVFHMSPLLDVDKTASPPVFHHLVSKLADGVTLEPNTTYYARVRARVPMETDGYGAWSSAASFTTLGAAVPQSFTLTLESNVGATPPGPGINSFSMPFAGPWYVYKIDGTKLEFGSPATNEVKTAYDLVRAINIAAGSNVVSTFGRWNKTEQKLEGVMVSYNSATLNDIDSTDVSGLQSISLSQGEGYQVYVSQDVTLVIKNTP